MSLKMNLIILDIKNKFRKIAYYLGYKEKMILTNCYANCLSNRNSKECLLRFHTLDKDGKCCNFDQEN